MNDRVRRVTSVLLVPQDAKDLSAVCASTTIHGGMS